MESGDVLADRYRLDRLLGRGGMGEVWGGRDLRLNRDVAVKVLRNADPDEADVRRFVREATVAAGLQHPGITVVFDAGAHDGQMFIVTELLSGKDLGKVLAVHPGGLPLEQVLDFGIQLADALAAAHGRGIIHRDLKPANLFIQADERRPGGRLKVCDFGLARDLASSSRVTVAGEVFGTPAYMAPEQWRTAAASPGTDLYAVGCILYEMLTGRVPFEGPSVHVFMTQHLTQPPVPPRDLKPGIPAALNDLVLSLLSKEAASRPASAAEVLAAATRARDARQQAPASAGKPGPGTRGRAGRTGRSLASRHPRAAAGITVSAAALLAALLVVVLPDSGASSSSTPHPSGSARPAPPTPSASLAGCASGTLTLDGSAFGSIAQKAAAAYSRQCKSAHFQFGIGNGKGSAWGVGQLENVVNDPSQAGSLIAMYDGTTTLAKGLKAHPIGLFIYSVVAHAGLYPGSDITLGALKQLFDEPGCVPGKLAVGLQAGSGTRLALQALLEKVPSDPNIPGTCSPPSGHATENTYEGALAIVSGTSNAIGYLAVDGGAGGHLDIDGHPTNSPDVAVLSIDGVAPTPENVGKGTYRFAAVETLYTVPSPSALALSFLAYLPRYLAEHQVPDFITCSSVPESMAAECPAAR